MVSNQQHWKNYWHQTHPSEDQSCKRCHLSWNFFVRSCTTRQ
jgi:hypothetical protein